MGHNDIWSVLHTGAAQGRIDGQLWQTELEMRNTVSCVVQNHSGVLAGISASFAEENINIASLAVGETEDRALSRMTIVVESEDRAIEDIIKHLKELEGVVEVEDVDLDQLIARELLLVTVQAGGEDIARIMQIVDTFRATVAGMSEDSLTVEMTGAEKRVNALIKLLRPFGILELARTGRVAVMHREEGLDGD